MITLTRSAAVMRGIARASCRLLRDTRHLGLNVTSVAFSDLLLSNLGLDSITSLRFRVPNSWYLSSEIRSVSCFECGIIYSSCIDLLGELIPKRQDPKTVCSLWNLKSAVIQGGTVAGLSPKFLNWDLKPLACAFIIVSSFELNLVQYSWRTNVGP